MNPAIFRAYDIRGVADQDLESVLVEKLGRAFATELRRRSRPASVAVGRDCRLTSPRLRDALVTGLRSAGANVIDIGVVPSPVLYFAAHHLSTGGSIIITGSHNPPQDNGFKLMFGTDTLHGEDISALRDRIEKDDFDTGEGRLDHIDLNEVYLDHALSAIEIGPRRFPVVIDAGNGTGGPLASELYRRLGFEVIELNCEMDGNFPNHHPDPTVEANLEQLKQKVSEHSAEVGLAFDGDADRLGAVDEQGRVLWGDQLMVLFGRAILEEVPGAGFIAEVKCSQTLFDSLTAAGGKPLMWKVGHSLIKAKMKETGALLSGEMSGHLFFAHRYLGFDDGIYAGARLLEVLSKSNQTLASMRDGLPDTVTTPEIRVECPDAHKFKVVDRVINALRRRDDVTDLVTLDGIRASFPGGWGLVRASNTGPVLVLRCEAETQAHLDRILETLQDTIKSAKSDL